MSFIDYVVEYFRGPTGATGPAGPAGVDGENGAPGVSGAPGLDGASLSLSHQEFYVSTETGGDLVLSGNWSVTLPLTDESGIPLKLDYLARTITETLPPAGFAITQSTSFVGGWAVYGHTDEDCYASFFVDYIPSS